MDVQHTDNWGPVRSTITTVVGPLDGVSGSPVMDLKPTMAEFRAVKVKQSERGSRLMWGRAHRPGPGAPGRWCG
ncbi:hypothetical protein OG985_05610 [Streptomyces sp. NBC_00289]|uniref:hypothetical protein n=1 Tax=Streptomyces sp. NBC_00289 TaxID=2975703 RepID=UPI00324FF3C5